ncbi:MAG TPA: baseplate J/gp47 family protein [Candidatus Hydrothermia bacterium]|nr:baseplate J/gp47 family protein [Candidatus Hydrothermia bacterium]
MINIRNIPEPVFVEADWDNIYKELFQTYERVAGQQLSKGQLEAVLLSIFAYRENLLRIIINETAKQNLLAFARGEVLDHLGALLGVSRLTAQPARTIIRFYFSGLDQNILIPKETMIASRDGKVVFETEVDVQVPAQTEYIDVYAVCTQAGTVGNGYIQGQIAELVDPMPFVEKVENVSISYGGQDDEDDERFRARIQLAPEAFSNAGSKGAYKFWARTAHQDIADVSVLSPEPGIVKVVVLLKDGQIPGDEILEQVYTILNDEKIRPLTDYVIISAPEVVEYEIDGEIYLYKDIAFANEIIKQAQKFCEQYASTLKNSLGRDIVPEQIIEQIQKIGGVYRVVLNEPSYTKLSVEEVAVCTNISLTIAGSEDG